ncbi:MAG: ABC transporter permease subunit [Pseudorhodobacter sp.]
MRATAIWVAALGLFWAFATLAKPLLPWAFDWPKALVMPAAKWISRATKWLLNDASFGLFTFQELTRWISAVVEAPYRVVTGLLSEGIGPMAPLSWLSVVVLVALIGHRAGGLRLAMLAGACFVFIAVFGQWTSAMITLASILIAVPIGVAGGMALGLAAYRWPWFARAITPVLDLMQTIPVFAYLVPILILFGFGPVAAVIATVIYAMPPMTRITQLSLQRVPAELRDLGNMIGCSRRQMTWKVMVPSAKEGLMVGVNQVIMLSLNMVIIASMIGAGGLGFDVLAALRRLDFGAGLEAGFAIVALAIALDRISQALAHEREIGLAAHNGYLWGAIGTLGIAATLAFLLPELQHYPQAWQLSTGTFWSKVVEWININYFDTLEAVKNALLINVLIPFKRFLISLPWAAVALLLGFVGWRLQGPRLAMLVTVLVMLIAATGLWDKAMTTVYLCGISVAIAMLIGLPIGVIAAERDSLWRWVRLAIDTLQTLPSFVYLMPAVMLFRVGDFTAMIAVVAYAVAPAIRYTALGLQAVDPRLIEAGRAMGCTNWQILTRIKLRLALPEIMLGLNQTIMFALSMLVITALVGTRDLGQEVYIALTKADSGRGLVAGLSVAFIAIIADRLIGAAAARARAQLGLADGGGHGA